MKYFFLYIFLLVNVFAKEQYEMLNDEYDKFGINVNELHEIYKEKAIFETVFLSQIYNKLRNQLYLIDINTESFVEDYIKKINELKINEDLKNAYRDYQSLEDKYRILKNEILINSKKIELYTGFEQNQLNQSVKKITNYISEIDLNVSNINNLYFKNIEKLLKPDFLIKNNIFDKKEMNIFIENDLNNLKKQILLSHEKLKDLEFNLDNEIKNSKEVIANILKNESFWNKYKEIIIAIIGLFTGGGIVGSIVINKNFTKFKNKKIDNIYNKRQKANRDIVNISNGLSIVDATILFDKLIELNLPKLVDEASEKAFERLDEFRKELFSNINSKNPNGFDKFNDPDIQFTLNECQKSYAKSGKQELKKLLIDLFSKKIFEEDELEIVLLNEAISIAPKITIEQIKILKDLYYLNNVNGIINTMDSLKEFLLNNTFKYKYSDLSHLIYLGLINHNMTRLDIDIYLTSNSFPYLFNKGFLDTDMSEDFKKYVYENNLIVNNKYNQERIDFVEKVKIANNFLPEANKLFSAAKMNKGEIINLLNEVGVNYNDISNKFKSCDFSHHLLSEMGRVLVQSYIESK